MKSPAVLSDLRFLAFLTPLLGLISACSSSGGHITGVDQLTLSPGDTGTCQSSPCQISLRMPAGSGSYEVTANEVKVGVYPAGQIVSLGGFFESQAFAIKGLDVPKAYAYIPEEL